VSWLQHLNVLNHFFTNQFLQTSMRLHQLVLSIECLLVCAGSRHLWKHHKNLPAGVPADSPGSKFFTGLSGKKINRIISF